MAAPVDPKRQAAAIEALRAAVPPKSEAETFWQRHGGKVVVAAALLLGLWLVSRAVGAFVRSSVDGTTRAQEDLRRGLHR